MTVLDTPIPTVKPDDKPRVLEDLTDDECALWAILTDPSGLDQAEFLWYDTSTDDGCFRAWPYQWTWWRTTDAYQIDQCARSVGKSLSIKVRGFAFPFLFPGQEMVITAPELVHLEPIVGLIENQIYATRLSREMLMGGRSAVTHRPFQMNFQNSARIIGRIPQRDGKGVKGCETEGALILTDGGYVPVEDLTPGTLVLTHEGNWKPVRKVIVDENDCYEVRGQSSFPMIVSCDHRFLGAENLAGPKAKRDFTPLGFHDVEILTDYNVYWATPTEFPALPVPEIAGGRFDQHLSDFWWLVGRYLADGFVSQNGAHPTAKVHWIAPAAKADALLAAAAALDVHMGRQARSHSSADDFTVCSRDLGAWIAQHFGRHADDKKLPAWALGMSHMARNALLEGYLAGDGWFNKAKKRWEVGTASKVLAVGVQMLAQSLGHTVNCTVVQPKPNAVCADPKPSWRLQIGHGHPVEIDGCLVAKVKSVTPVGKRKIFNVVVEDDHSYISGSIVSHNIHPIWLELDEAQDYPHAGWVELTETLKKGFEGAVWRAHGVTRGLRDDFYEKTQDTPENHWTVHRYPAMYRPTWTDQEREEKIKEYGSADDPDYRRNVLGLHGDSTNPLFVLTRLMKCVDDDPLSDYNADEYTFLQVKEEAVQRSAEDIRTFIDLPARHLKYLGANPAKPKAIFWAGMDIGMTIDPSEILVWAEYRKKPTDEFTVMRLLTRLNLVRIGTTDQIKAILHVIDFYKPKAFAMDRGGLGQPFVETLQDWFEAEQNGDPDRLVPGWAKDYNLRDALTRIKGYNFGEKLTVDLDPTIEVGDFDDPEKVAGQRRNAKEYASDTLRTLVDQTRLEMPWDAELLKQWQGGTWTSAKGLQDQYGRRIFSKGNDHTLDAGRFFALGWAQFGIEEILAKSREAPPILVQFMS